MRNIYIILGLLCILGCRQDITLQPIEKSIDLAVVDQRPSASDFESRGYIYYEDILPLIPYWTRSQHHHLPESFLPELQSKITKTAVFSDITTMEDSRKKRNEQEITVTVYLHKSKSNFVSARYGLGFAAFVVHLLGAPSHFQNATLEMEIEYREGEKVFRDRTNCSTTSSGGIYYDSQYPMPKTLEKCLKKSIAKYLKHRR